MYSIVPCARIDANVNHATNGIIRIDGTRSPSKYNKIDVAIAAPAIGRMQKKEAAGKHQVVKMSHHETSIANKP